ncbi:MAG: tripartite tricarboxylate transporter substrate-binding protein [Christensenellales bacterium]
MGTPTATGVDGMCFEIATEGLSQNTGAVRRRRRGQRGPGRRRPRPAGRRLRRYERPDRVRRYRAPLVFCVLRLSIFPDCECTAEVGIDSFAGPWRGIFAKKGTPQGAIDALVAAIEECRKDASWKEFLPNAPDDERTVPAPGEELKAFVQKEYKDLHDYMVEQETLEKDYEDLK